MDRRINSRSGNAVLIYDGECPICSSAMGWIMDHEAGSLEVLTCRSNEMKKRYPLITETDCMQAMQLVLPDGDVLAGEKALPEIIKRLHKRYRSAAALFKLPGSTIIARVFYRWFASRRYRLAKMLFPKR